MFVRVELIWSEDTNLVMRKERSGGLAGNWDLDTFLGKLSISLKPHYICHMDHPLARVLIIDDDIAVCSGISLLLKKHHMEVKAIQQPAIALDTIAEWKPRVIVLDMNFTIDTSGKQGMRLLKLIRGEYPEVSVLLITGWATVQLAVEGMKLGAKDFLAKPWDNKYLLDSIETMLTLQKPRSSSGDLNNEKDAAIIGEDPELKRILHMAEKIAPTEASVLITGESGTGKELIAEFIHRKSKRKDGPFVKVNLGGISQSLFESELFGHKKGAFTDAHSDRKGRFEMANGGTIFLDEIGELPLGGQVKLLRVLQEKTFEILGSSRAVKADSRVISATNRNLQERIALGEFREDLYYRINLIQLHLPPLRERKGDIHLLTKSFLRQLSGLYDCDEPIVEEEAMNWLMHLDYPGNIRQLRNMIERCFLLNMGSPILTIHNIQSSLQETQQLNSEITLPKVGQISLEEMEVAMIKKTLQFHQSNISETARALGLTRSALYRRLEKYNIPYDTSH